MRPPALDVCFTPEEIRPAQVAIVIDVLRATSTIAQALAAGYPRVVCCRSVGTARALRAPGSVLRALTITVESAQACALAPRAQRQ